MAIEIERRFLIKNNDWRNHIIDKVVIEQGYFGSNFKDWIIRIRAKEEHYFLTLKKHIANSSSHEFEYEIPKEDGRFMLSNLANKIKKERFTLIINNEKWIIDSFNEKNYPLLIAEIELKNKLQKINLPKFISSEITGLKIFSNFELSKNPYSCWSKTDRKIFTKD